MSSSNGIPRRLDIPVGHSVDDLRDLRERHAMAKLEAEERRLRERAEQTSPMNDARTRVRAWEKSHGLTMPRAAGHPVLLQIAQATQLTMDEIHAEQRRRSEPAVAAVAPIRTFDPPPPAS